MIDGASSVTALVRSWQHAGRWSADRGTNLLDGSAPFYRAYECADHGFMAVGALEDVYYDRFVRGLGLDPAALPDRWDRSNWNELAERFDGIFASGAQRLDGGLRRSERLCHTGTFATGGHPSQPRNPPRGIHRHRRLHDAGASPTAGLDARCGAAAAHRGSGCGTGPMG